MSLSPKQKFKAAFLAVCAEAGLTPAETTDFVKRAIQHKKATPGAAAAMSLGSLASWLWPAATTGATAIGATAIGAPIAAGAGGGLLAAKFTGRDHKSDLEDAKTDEIVSEYERLAEEARRRAQLKHLQQSTGRRVIALTPGE